MAQSPPRTGSGSKAAAGGGGRRRTPPPQVKKPFPWGVVATSAVLGLLLLGIIVYAVLNQGAGFESPLKRADKKVEDVKVTNDLKRDHVEKTVDYGKNPPVGGAHNDVPQKCQVYTQPVANEHAVHSLEHGAVWITYRPDLAAGDVAKLAALVQGNPSRMLSPFPGLSSPIRAHAWGRQLFVDSPTDKRLTEFLDAYTGGPQAPERGSACDGTTQTGSLSAQTPEPGASGMPQPSK
jgi:hypothetical protein